MTTSRRIFTSMHIDISKQSFRDVYNAVKAERDFSEATMREAYGGRLRNRILRDDEVLDVSAVLSIEDCYDLGEESDDDSHIDLDNDAFDELIVFNSADDDKNSSILTIKEMLSNHETILKQVVADSYLYLEFKVVLTPKTAVEVDTLAFPEVSKKVLQPGLSI